MRPASDCRAVDSLLAHARLRQVHVRGRATIDVDDYRVRGRFLLDVDADGAMTLAIESTVGMGSRREDVVVAWAADTLRVLDRERGDYWEGEAVDARLAEALDEPVDAGALVRRVLLALRCAAFDGARARADGLAGRLEGEPFRVALRHGRPERAEWPAPVGRDGSERLRVEYRWIDGRLRGLTVRIPGRRWRLRLDGEDSDER